MLAARIRRPVKAQVEAVHEKLVPIDPQIDLQFVVDARDAVPDELRRRTGMSPSLFR